MKTKILYLLILLFTVSLSYAQKTERYLVITPHSKEQCLTTLDEVKATGPDFLAKFDFGCKSGDHTAYVILEAENEDALKKTLPASIRNDAKIIKVTKFTAEEIEEIHKSMK